MDLDTFFTPLCVSIDGLVQTAWGSDIDAPGPDNL